MDDFSVNGFDSKVSRSSSSPNEAVLSVKLDFVKKTINGKMIKDGISFKKLKPVEKSTSYLIA